MVPWWNQWVQRFIQDSHDEAVDDSDDDIFIAGGLAVIAASLAKLADSSRATIRRVAAATNRLIGCATSNFSVMAAATQQFGLVSLELVVLKKLGLTGIVKRQAPNQPRRQGLKRPDKPGNCWRVNSSESIPRLLPQLLRIAWTPETLRAHASRCLHGDAQIAPRSSTISKIPSRTL